MEESMHSRNLLIAALWVLAAALAGAQKLPENAPPAVLDGVIRADEYAVTVPLDKMTLYASRTADALFVAVSAQTTGWVSFGVGSTKMDRAWIYIGYAKGDQVVFARQQGAGHSHKDNAAAPAASYSIKENAGVTTMELVFKAVDLIASGQKALDCIVAFGRQDSLGGYHAFRGVAKLQL